MTGKIEAYGRVSKHSPEGEWCISKKVGDYRFRY